MICDNKQALQREVNTGRAIIQVRASLVESLAEEADIGTDSIAESITNTLASFSGTRHVLNVQRRFAERLLTPASTAVDDEEEDESYIDEDDEPTL